jgi:putative Ca2+/H+ antiporter (TMEM165/GDT1 family)
VIKVNGETITGIALIFLAFLFIMAGMVNSVWALLFWADILILVIGVAFVVLGIWSLKTEIMHMQSQRIQYSYESSLRSEWIVRYSVKSFQSLEVEN